MATIFRILSALALAGMFLAACGTTSTAPTTENWTYVGTDEAIRFPPRVPRGDLSVSAWMASRQMSEAAWWEKREAIIEQAKAACARETGQSPTPGYWMGYSGAFKDCMNARGWSPGGSPL